MARGLANSPCQRLATIYGLLGRAREVFYGYEMRLELLVWILNRDTMKLFSGRKSAQQIFFTTCIWHCIEFFVVLLVLSEHDESAARSIRCTQTQIEMNAI